MSNPLQDRAPPGGEGEPILVIYRNWRGEVAQRRIRPAGPPYWGTTEWHPEPGWLLPAIDAEKGEYRDFALKDCDFTIARQAEPGVICNRCGWAGDEDGLVATLDAEDGEPCRACPDCGTDANLMDVLSPQPGGKTNREALIDLIGELGREVFHLLDDCETSGPVGEEVHTITDEGLTKVSAVLDRIDALPFEEPGAILGTGAKLQAALKQTFVQMQPEPRVICLPYPMHGYGVCVGGRYDGWLMWQHPDGQWVTKANLESVDPRALSEGHATQKP